MPLFSVIVPAYNREKYVSATLNSVLGQTCADWECVVVDDGSSDSTRSIVREFAAKDQRIRLIERANGGPGAARNQGTWLANGKYIAFLDSDDVWMPWTLETYRDALERAGWPEYLAGHLRNFSCKDDISKWPKDPMQVEQFPDALTACGFGSVVAGVGMTVVSAEAFRRAGGFSEDRINAEDHDFTLRLGECRGFVAMCAPVTVGYRQHGEQETASQSKTVDGILRLVDREHSGVYPGGPERAYQRHAIIASHARPVCLAALKTGNVRSAWRLYFATFRWQLQGRRWRFLIAFPFLTLTAPRPD